MSAFVIYQCDISNPEAYDAYRALAAPAVAAYGGKYVARGGEVTVLEGKGPRSRVVVLEFPDADAARTWYASDEYLAARKLRAGAAEADVFVVEGT
jgi:uncharacterized protein (DUF1330 family)